MYRYNHNGENVCKLHLNQLKLKEDPCCVCMEEMTRPSSIKLGCGHMFHTNCMIKWGQQGKDTCPMCRAPMDTASLVAIHRETIDYLGKVIFSLPSQRERGLMVDAISTAITNTFATIERERMPPPPPPPRVPQYYVHYPQVQVSTYGPSTPTYTPIVPSFDERMRWTQERDNGNDQEVPMVPMDPRIPNMVERVV
jgi:hypothetical protein